MWVREHCTFHEGHLRRVRLFLLQVTTSPLGVWYAGYGVLVLLLKSFSISPKEVEAEKTGATGKVIWILVRSGVWGGLVGFTSLYSVFCHFSFYIIVVSMEEHLTFLPRRGLGSKAKTFTVDE